MTASLFRISKAACPLSAKSFRSRTGFKQGLAALGRQVLACFRLHSHEQNGLTLGREADVRAPLP